MDDIDERIAALRRRLAEFDPDVLAAEADVDRTLIRSYLRLDPWARLSLAARAADELSELAACRSHTSKRSSTG